MTREQLLEYAALAECYSSHPISRSLKTAYGTEIDEARVGEIEEISGNGISARVDGVRVRVGNKKWLKQAGIAVPEVKTSGSVD